MACMPRGERLWITAAAPCIMVDRSGLFAVTKERPMDQDNLVAFPQPSVLEPADPSSVGLRREALDRLGRIIEGHIGDNRAP